MKILIALTLSIGCLNALLAQADNVIAGAPLWSTPTRGSEIDQEQDMTKLWRIAGSNKQYSQQAIDDKFNAPDWNEGDHAAMPDIVKHGKKPKVWACASCHLASGLGHPESASLAGLSASYIERQLEDFSSGSRLDYSGHMNRMAEVMTMEERKEAAVWFASLKRQDFLDVVETDAVPLTVIDDTRMRTVAVPAGVESINGRIIEVPEDLEQTKLRVPVSRFISYVPKGAIAKGKNIVTTGGGKTAPCTVCHGPDLTGGGLIPSIVGNFASYTVRQLHGFKSKTRISAEMLPVVSPLSDSDIVNIAAYLASLKSM